jgi:hypothetical protein
MKASLLRREKMMKISNISVVLVFASITCCGNSVAMLKTGSIPLPRDFNMESAYGSHKHPESHHKKETNTMPKNHTRMSSLVSKPVQLAPAQPAIEEAFDLQDFLANPTVSVSGVTYRVFLSDELKRKLEDGITKVQFSEKLSDTLKMIETTDYSPFRIVCFNLYLSKNGDEIYSAPSEDSNM